MLLASGNRSSSVLSTESVTDSINEYDEEESQETSRESRAIILLVIITKKYEA